MGSLGCLRLVRPGLSRRCVSSINTEIGLGSVKWGTVLWPNIGLPKACQRMAGAEAATAHPHQPMCTDPGGNEWVERAPVGWPGVNCAYPAHAQIIPPFRLPRPLTHAVRVVAARADCKQRVGCYQCTLLIHRGASEPTRTWKGGMRTSHRRGRPKKPDVWPQNPRPGPLCVVPRGHSAG